MTKATFLLIPGAGGDERYWYLIVLRLRALGHDAVAVSLPAGDDSAGWKEYADVAVDALGRHRSSVIVVAQSLGGFSAPLVCERVPVELLVMLNAMIPTLGETGEAWWSNTGQGDAMRDHLISLGLSPADADDDDVVYFHDVPAQVRQEAFGQVEEPQQSWTPMTEPWPLETWPDVPTRVLVGRDDRLFPADFQRRVARERLGIETDEIAGGHLVALSKPEFVVERIEAYRTARSMR
jgi:pimeloyl-ACP methyl ester carboxylesterase